MDFEMKVYRDPDTSKTFEVVKYKSNVEEIGLVYAPYIPNASGTVLDQTVTFFENEKGASVAIFMDEDNCFSEKGQEIWDWLSILPPEEWDVDPNLQNNSDITVNMLSKEKAALFKLWFL